MSRWSELSFVHESHDIPDPLRPGLCGQVLVTFNTYASGSYDEPMLELDGDLVIELLDGPGGSPARDLTLDDFSEAERLVIQSRVEELIYETQNAYADDIGFSIAERAADSLYEAWKDRDE